MERTLLALYAHPDDETFATGGTLARYAHEGVRVVLGCATRGEAGIVHDEGAGEPADLGQVREQELRCACRVLGVRDLRFLGYRDSGMEGTPDNRHPAAFAQADAGEVVGRILELFREFQPQVVLTFGPPRGYNHPDHIAIHRHATAAWRLAGGAEADPFLSAEPPRELYYTARPRRLYHQYRVALWERGLLAEPPSEEYAQSRGASEEEITTRIEVGDYLELKREALRCHRTQVSPTNPWLNVPEDLARHYLRYDHFILASARGIEIGPGEVDLFAGLE
jgi:LmbE family N-acetylglucosaminyl deacetylase